MISFDAITIGRIDQVLIEQEVSAGPEGDGDTASLSPSSVGSYTFNFTLGDRCQTVLTSAANDSSITCALENGFLSPTSGGPSCPRGDGSTDAHWGNRGGGAKWDYHSFSTSPLDFKATFGTTIKAPFNGKLTYKPGTGGACGNQISLKSSETGGIVSLCHIKDFAGKKTGDEVLRGEIIGHAGGHYCGATLGGGEPPTEGWFYRDQMIANASGSNVCDDPKIPESCDCQTWQQSGQTTGPHVHITWAQTRAGNFLKCLLEGNHQ